jgi:hypothetical protein
LSDKTLSSLSQLSGLQSLKYGGILSLKEKEGNTGLGVLVQKSLRELVILVLEEGLGLLIQTVGRERGYNKGNM